MTGDYYWWWKAGLTPPDWIKQYECFSWTICIPPIKNCIRSSRLIRRPTNPTNDNDNNDNDNNDGPNTPPGGVIELGPRMSQAGRTLGRTGSGHGKIGPLV